MQTYSITVDVQVISSGTFDVKIEAKSEDEARLSAIANITGQLASGKISLASQTLMAAEPTDLTEELESDDSSEQPVAAMPTKHLVDEDDFQF